MDGYCNVIIKEKSLQISKISYFSFYEVINYKIKIGVF